MVKFACLSNHRETIMPIHQRNESVWGGVFAVSMILMGCSMAPQPHTLIYEESRGSVYLITVPEGSFHASHPAFLSPALVARVLSGIQVQEVQRLLQTLVSGEPTTVPVFSDEDTAFLAPHVAAALSQVTSQQRVGFRVLHKGGAGTEITGGELSAHGSSLRISLTQYRYNPGMPKADSKPGRYPSSSARMSQLRFRFMPEAAQKTDTLVSSESVDDHSRATVVVDYQALGHPPVVSDNGLPGSLPEKHEMPQSKQTNSDSGSQELPIGPTEELQALRVLIEKQAKELEALKNEVKNLRQEEKERDATSPNRKTRKQPASRKPGTMQ